MVTDSFLSSSDPSLNSLARGVSKYDPDVDLHEMMRTRHVLSFLPTVVPSPLLYAFTFNFTLTEQRSYSEEVPEEFCDPRDPAYGGAQWEKLPPFLKYSKLREFVHRINMKFASAARRVVFEGSGPLEMLGRACIEDCLQANGCTFHPPDLLTDELVFDVIYNYLESKFITFGLADMDVHDTVTSGIFSWLDTLPRNNILEEIFDALGYGAEDPERDKAHDNQSLFMITRNQLQYFGVPGIMGNEPWRDSMPTPGTTP